MTTTKTIRCGRCKGTHGSAAEVRSCHQAPTAMSANTLDLGDLVAANKLPSPADAARRAARVVAGHGGQVATVDGPPPATARPAFPATEKQEAFIRRLANERAADETTQDPRSIAEVLGDGVLDATIAGLTKREASALIDAWLTLPHAPAVTPDEADSHHTAADSDHLARGRVHVLELDGVPTYVRVHVSQRTGKPYAANLDGGLEWEYAPGLVHRLTAGSLVTPEQAKAFGELTERCVFCSTPIDTPESTAVGYGPTCAARNGLPWG